MKQNLALGLFLSLLLIFPACEKRATTPQSEASAPLPSASPEKSREVKFNACTLITKEEVAAIQGSPVRDAKNSGRVGVDAENSQCFYTATEFSKSINLVAVQADPESRSGRGPKDIWEKMFNPSKDEQDKGRKEHEGGEGGERESIPPTRVDGVGDDAYWVGSRVGGALYVLKGNAFIFVGIGGSDEQKQKIDKTKALAKKAIERL